MVGLPDGGPPKTLIETRNLAARRDRLCAADTANAQEQTEGRSLLGSTGAEAEASAPSGAGRCSSPSFREFGDAHGNRCHSPDHFGLCRGAELSHPAS
jgi:hypothetical protein